VPGFDVGFLTELSGSTARKVINQEISTYLHRRNV
jgi:hypothetical protein